MSLIHDLKNRRYGKAIYPKGIAYRDQKYYEYESGDFVHTSTQEYLIGESTDTIDSILEELNNLMPETHPHTISRYYCPFCREKQSGAYQLNKHMDYCTAWKNDPTGKAEQLATRHLIRRISDLAKELAEDVRNQLGD